MISAKKIMPLIVVIASCLFFATPSGAKTDVHEDVQPPFSDIAGAKPVSLNNCLESILNALRYSEHNKQLLDTIAGQTDAERNRNLMAQYGIKPSTDYSTGTRLRDDGMSSPDLLAVYNDFRAVHKLKPLSGTFLDRAKDETPKQLLERVHGLLLNSIKQGELPIIQIRSQAAQLDDQTSQYAWHGLNGYAVTVVSVPDATNPDGSFTVKYIDSVTGNKDQLIVFNDPRNFAASKTIAGSTVWLKDRPFAVVAAPSLYLGTPAQTWYMRTVMFLGFAIYQK